MIPLQMSFREKHPVTHVAFSPDQGTIAVAQPHAGVTLLERGTGRTVAVCPTPRRGVLTGLAFTGDGRLLVTASAKGLSVFDARSGAFVTTSGNRGHKLLRLAAHGNGTVGAKDGRVRTVWANQALCTAELASRPAPEWAEALALAPGGATALLRSARRLELFDIRSARTVAEGAVGEESVAIASFCPVGRRVAVNDGTTLDVYDLAEVASEEQYEDEQPATALVQRASGSNQAAAVETAPMPRAVLEPHFRLHPEKASDAGEWRPPFALLADGRGLLVKRPRNRVQLWDAPAGALVNEWSWRLEWVTCLAVSPDGLTAVAGGRFGRVLLWDLD